MPRILNRNLTAVYSENVNSCKPGNVTDSPEIKVIVMNTGMPRILREKLKSVFMYMGMPQILKKKLKAVYPGMQRIP